MLNKEMEAALNEQVNNELYSAYLYLSMAAWFEERNLGGFAHWMRLQFEEEQAHALKIFDYINERGGAVKLEAIATPTRDWETVLAVFEYTLNHEQEVTASINRLVDLAIKTSDHASNAHLQWFVSEQVEEEASADQAVQQLKMIENAPGGIFMFDRELGQRVFTPPAAEGE